MRVTVHLDSFDRLDPAAYAIVWIDTFAGKWSREGHAGVELPEWGRCARVPGGTTLVASDDLRDICTIEGLDLSAGSGPFEGESGRVQWHARANAEPLAARWHVQCVDESALDPEEGLFADEA
jgi:hypothetical protein